ncbi:MAG: DUF3185 domain-containing protein [bacterium]
MRPLMVLGILLIALGVVALAYEGISYTRTKTVVDLGPIQARVEEKRTIPLPPILGGLALAGGILLVLAGARGREGAHAN